jgi:PAS domain S-box-containing protein
MTLAPAAPAAAKGYDHLIGGGEMGALMREHQWFASPLGAAEGWPLPLKTLVGVMLGSNQPMFIAWGPERTLLYNDTYAEILASKHPAALGRDFLEVWSEIRADLVPIVSQAYAGGPVQMDDIKLVMDRKGYPEETHFSFFYAPVRDEGGRVGGLYCACNEITGQVLAERRRRESEIALRESEARFRVMADAVPQIIWITDRDGRTEFFNKQWSNYTGAAFEATTAADIAANFVHPDDGAATVAAFEEARRAGTTFLVEHRIRSKTGDYRWFLVRGEPYHDQQTGQIVRWFGASVDIHDRRRAEAALRESEARLSFLDRLGAETAPLVDADSVLATTTRLLGEHLHLSVCAYADMDEDENGFTIRGDWAAPGSQSIVGHYSLADFGKLAVENLSAGVPLVINDNLRELAPEEAATFQSIGIAATICMPLVKEGRLTALMAIHDRVPRVWTEAELGLLREVTARSWSHVERVASTAELRESEARLRELNETLEARVTERTAERNHLWTLSQDMLARADFGGMMSAVSPAWTRVLGWSETELLTRPYAFFMHPDDMEPTLAPWPA